jgi:hypothetical protein
MTLLPSSLEELSIHSIANKFLFGKLSFGKLNRVTRLGEILAFGLLFKGPGKFLGKYGLL